VNDNDDDGEDADHSSGIISIALVTHPW
jgi:hypothetical protein